MPELPDLQVFSRNLAKKILGKEIKRVRVPVTKKLKVPVETLKKQLVGQVVKKVFREGKELHIAFKNGNILGLHIMLHGDLHYFTEKNQNKNTIIEILFHDDTGLALTDWQKMATPTLNPQQRDSPDALSRDVNFRFLKSTLQKTRSNVKNVLIDQDLIRGIGNAYADEILWDAGISPFSASNKIPDDKIRALAKSIRKVLVDAEKKIIKAHPDIINGEVRDFLLIHHPRKGQSPTGSTIRTKVVGSRKTYYTDEQQLYN